MSHTIYPTDLPHPSPEPHFKTFLVFLTYFPKCPSFRSYKSNISEKNFQLLNSEINFVLIFFCSFSKLLLGIPKAKMSPLAVHHHSNMLVMLVPCILHVGCVMINYLSIRRTYIKIILDIICVLYFREKPLCKTLFCLTIYLVFILVNIV